MFVSVYMFVIGSMQRWYLDLSGAILIFFAPQPHGRSAARMGVTFGVKESTFRLVNAKFHLHDRCRDGGVGPN